MDEKKRGNWLHPLRNWRRKRTRHWEAAAEFAAEDGFDPLGSYSGLSEDEDDAPEQDADDL